MYGLCGGSGLPDTLESGTSVEEAEHGVKQLGEGMRWGLRLPFSGPPVSQISLLRRFGLEKFCAH